MFGHTKRHLSRDLRTDAKQLDAACRHTLGVSATVFRATKFLFHIATLLFAVYLIEATPISTAVAVGVAILLITGPEGLETYLIRQDILPDPDQREGDD